MQNKQVKTFAVALLALALVASAACGGGTSPTETVKAFAAAAQKKDKEGVKKYLSKSSVNYIETTAKAVGKTPDDFYDAMLEAAAKEGGTPDVRNESINGDSATVEVKDAKSNNWQKPQLVKEDGQWRIAFDKSLSS